VKSGFNRTGSQRYQCQLCLRQHTPESHPLGYDDQTKAMALKLYLEGNGFRRIGRLLSVNHQSVINWINAYYTQLRTEKTAAPVSESPGILEMDEMFTFIRANTSPSVSSRLLTERLAALSRTKSAGSARRKWGKRIK
jgi:hypothetical protein